MPTTPRSSFGQAKKRRLRTAHPRYATKTWCYIYGVVMVFRDVTSEKEQRKED
ncbi:MAG: hypothetical protein R2912_11510 [Eubacteriales bacterium]